MDLMAAAGADAGANNATGLRRGGPLLVDSSCTPSYGPVAMTCAEVAWLTGLGFEPIGDLRVWQPATSEKPVDRARWPADSLLAAGILHVECVIGFELRVPRTFME